MPLIAQNTPELLAKLELLREIVPELNPKMQAYSQSVLAGFAKYHHVTRAQAAVIYGLIDQHETGQYHAKESYYSQIPLVGDDTPRFRAPMQQTHEPEPQATAVIATPRTHIKVHVVTPDYAILIRIGAIDQVDPGKESGSLLTMTNGSELRVTESFDDIAAMMGIE